MVLAVENSLTSAGDTGAPCSIPGSGRSQEERCGNPLQYSCLENPMDGGAWWAKLMVLQRVGHTRYEFLVPQMHCLPDHVLYAYLCFYVKPV